MALFLVVALGTAAPIVDQQIPARVEPAEYYKIESGKWIANVNLATSKEVSDFLGITATALHLVVPVRGYFGRAQPDLWEWLAAKTSKANA
jgi:hypothetical protein